MRMKRLLLSAFSFLIVLIILLALNYIPGQRIRLHVQSAREDEYQFFYAQAKEDFTEADSQKKLLDPDMDTELSYDPGIYSCLRIDMGTQEEYELSDLMVDSLLTKTAFGEEQIVFTCDVSYAGDENVIHITRVGEDPYLVFDLTDVITENKQATAGIMFLIDVVIAILLAVCVYLQYEHMKILIWWTVDILKNFHLIFSLAISDFKTRYAASYLGMVWAFVQPIVTVVIYVVVFGYGFKTTPVRDFPFVLWLVAGIVPWFYFSDALLSATNSLKEYSYLVKKVVFEIKILPLVKIMAALLIHFFFLFVAVILYLANGYYPQIYYLQLIYYMFCCTALTLGLSYLTSALNVFVPDLSQVINIALQFGLWMTPIMWSPSMFGERIEKIIRINPLYYIVEGYRDSFYNHTAFWEKPGLTIYFWVFTIGCLILGMYSFRKLERHFADVL